MIARQENYNTWQLCIGKFNVLLKVILLFNIVKVYVDFIFTFLFYLKLWFIYEKERETFNYVHKGIVQRYSTIFFLELICAALTL